jgi:hypothetical protein
MSNNESEAEMHLRYARMYLEENLAKLAAMGDGDGYARLGGYAPAVIADGFLKLAGDSVDISKRGMSITLPGEVFLRALFGDWTPRKEVESQIRIYQDRVDSYERIVALKPKHTEP